MSSLSKRINIGCVILGTACLVYMFSNSESIKKQQALEKKIRTEEAAAKKKLPAAPATPLPETAAVEIPGKSI